jgi:crotonobetainyl-CoA:carnitine CoA-transferase CaiB-like acyl-CoA transferase
VLAVGNDSQFAAFAQLARHPEWATDPRFVHNADRVAHRAELVDLLAAAIATRTRAAWEAGCEAAGIPCGAILDVNEALAHPQTAARGGVVAQQTTEGEVVRTLPNPLHFSATPVSFRAPPPGLDADHDAVLADWLGR